jgi:CRISPR-associated endoribonuclease Cas6
MEYYELTLTVQLAEDLEYTFANDRIGQEINKAMLMDSELIEMHGRKGFKHYSFNSFYPIEKDGVYKAGRVYIFKIRSLYISFVRKIKMLLSENAELFRVLSIQSKTVKKNFITNLYTITPVVVTIEDGKRWVKEEDFLLLQKQLQSNLEKKYNDFFGVEYNKDDNFSFIQRIELLNRKPMVLNYKKIKFLGNKFKIWINEDEKSQKLAFTALACGLGEKNTTVGAGFCTGGDRL